MRLNEYGIISIFPQDLHFLHQVYKHCFDISKYFIPIIFYYLIVHIFNINQYEFN